MVWCLNNLAWLILWPQYTDKPSEHLWGSQRLNKQVIPSQMLVVTISMRCKIAVSSRLFFLAATRITTPWLKQPICFISACMPTNWKSHKLIHFLVHSHYRKVRIIRPPLLEQKVSKHSCIRDVHEQHSPGKRWQPSHGMTIEHAHFQVLTSWVGGYYITFIKTAYYRPTPLFQHALKWSAHGRILSTLRYYRIHLYTALNNWCKADWCLHLGFRDHKVW